MDVIGKWKVVGMSNIDANLNKVYVPLSEYNFGGSAFFEAMVTNQIYEFCSDGILHMTFFVPPEMRAELEKDGVMLENGTTLRESYPWKEEQGELFYKSGQEGGAFGEKNPEYTKITTNENFLYLDQVQLEKIK